MNIPYFCLKNANIKITPNINEFTVINPELGQKHWLSKYFSFSFKPWTAVQWVHCTNELTFGFQENLDIQATPQTSIYDTGVTVFHN